MSSPLEWSLDGVEFAYEAPLGTALPLGSFVRIDAGDAAVFGQVHTQSLVTTAPRVTGTRMMGGVGTVLATSSDGAGLQRGGAAPFADASMAPATSEELTALLARLHGDAPALDIGSMRDADGVGDDRARVLAKGFSRHTFMCGQSGSGKTFAMGVLLERLLIHTDIRIIVLDPNSDHVRMGTLLSREAAERTRSEPFTDEQWDELRSRHAVAASQVRVRRSIDADPIGSADDPALRLRVVDLGLGALARLIGIDPMRDDALWDALEQSRTFAPDVDSTAEFVERLAEHSDAGATVARRLRTSGITDWPLWSLRTTSIIDELDDPELRMLVADLGSLATGIEREAVSLAVLSHLWKHRAERRPTLIVIDEAHNVCPATPGSTLSAAATELATTIAAEGRKFGLHLLVATQRPDKVAENVVSQCDNLVLMRMNSAHDAAEIATRFAHVPEQMVRSANRFSIGEAVVGGPIATPPMMIRVEGRLTPEGGSDVPLDWTMPAALSSR